MSSEEFAVEHINTWMGDDDGQDDQVDMPAEGFDTDYGFVYGPMEVIRAAKVVGKQGKVKSFIITVATERESVDIYVSPGGRSIRVFRTGDGVELV